ncbi:hypothetical protein ACFQ0P_03620 [Microbacterium insulae]|uniref:Uncharacterized protein n=1 Tax=Microbacterium insulae TaxID=483014 RepID=A0ABW3AEW9_9MICO
MSAVGVAAELAAYRAATAELPRSARAAAAGAGVVVVVDGSGRWWTAARSAIAGGASGIVVARPERLPDEGIGDLIASGIPVVVERPLVRPDVTALALPDGVRPAAVTVECHARGLAAALRDAVGWARVVAGGALVLRQAASAAPGRSLALLESPSGLAVSLLAATQPGAPGGGRVRVTALGEELAELDADAGALRLATADAAGGRIAPMRWETSERLALRRVIDAVRTDSGPRDLVELDDDERLARAILSAPRS